MVRLNKEEVVWRDARGLGGWRSIKQYQRESELLYTRTMGYVLSEDEECLTLVQSQNEDGQVSDSMTIPLCQIKERIQLKGVSK